MLSFLYIRKIEHIFHWTDEIENTCKMPSIALENGCLSPSFLKISIIFLN
jgi:hypothetical protein